MIVDRERPTSAIAPPGMVRVDLDRFFAFTESLWREARDSGRDYLTWEQWNSWGNAAIRARIVQASDLTEEPRPPHVPDNVGMPYRPALRGEPVGARPDALFWRYSVIKTWRRVREAQELGRTDREFHRDESAALQHERELQEKRHREHVMRRVDAPTSGKPSRHRGAAGDTL